MKIPNLRMMAFALVSVVLFAGSVFTAKMISDAFSTELSLHALDKKVDINLDLLSQLAASLRTERAALEGELISSGQRLDAAELLANAPLDVLVQQAVEEIESKPEPETQVLFSYITPEARAATRELDVDLFATQAETIYGPLLNELDINDPRRSAILDELAIAFYNIQEAGWMRMNNEISSQEAAKIGRENSAINTLQTLLSGEITAEGIGAYLQARQEGNRDIQVVEELAIRFSSTLPVSEMHAFAALYLNEVGATSGASVNGQSPRGYEEQLAGLEHLRGLIPQLFGEEYAGQLNAFLTIQEESIKQALPQ